MKVKIKTNVKQVNRAIKSVPKGIVIPAAVMAINKAARDGRSEARSRMSKVTGVRRRAINKRVTGARKSAAASRKKLNASVYIRSSIGVKASEALGKKQAKKVSIASGKASKPFYAKMASGKQGLFRRTGGAKIPTKSGSYAGRISTRGKNKGQLIEREPIESLGSQLQAKEPRIQLHPHGTEAARKGFFSRAKKVLPKEFNRQINRKLANKFKS